MNQKYVEIEQFQKDTGLTNDMMKELYLLFVQELEHEKKKLMQCQTFQKNEMSSILHNIKGISSNYKAIKAAEIADSLHKKVKQQDIVDIQYYIQALTEVVSETTKEIINYFK